MAVLGINCATEHLSLAILRDGKFTEKSFNGQTIKAEQLLVYLEELLSGDNRDGGHTSTPAQCKLGTPLSEITKIGIAIGPGAFTGLRLSLVTAKTIALALKIPLVPVSTLAALARQYQTGNKNIRVILEACRGDVSTALFTAKLERLEPDHPVKREECPREKENLILENPQPDAKTIAQIAAETNAVFDQNILGIHPAYSHESRINYTTKPELQHLKIAKK